MFIQRVVDLIMIKFTLISCCYLFILVLHLFINGIDNQAHNIINNNNNVLDTKQWMYQSEAKWDNEWKQGQWNYMEKVAVERSRIAVIGGVFIQMFTHVNASVLDIGCGEGSISDFLNNQQKSNYVGVDLSKEAIQQALKVRGSPMTFVHAAAHLYRPSSRFDAIVFSDVLYYVEYEKVLRQYKGYLNDNGIVIISIFHMSEKLMYEGIFIFARNIFDKIDEIDISGYTQKNSRSKVEKTAFHIEVYRLKPGDTLDGVRGSSNVGAPVGGVGVVISSSSKVIDGGGDTTSSGGIVRVDNKGSIGVEYSHVVVNSTQSVDSSTSKPVNLINFDMTNSSTGNIDTISINSSSNNIIITKQQPLFYIYNLSEEYWWRWPINGSDCSGNGYVGHEHKENSGIGPLINADDGLYLTWHFSLFSSLYNRMKRSSRRTLDPSKATLFIIPYDLGLDGYLDANTCYTRRSCTNGLVGRLTTMLSHSR